MINRPNDKYQSFDKSCMDFASNNVYMPSTNKRTAKKQSAPIFIQFLMNVNCHRKVNSFANES